MLSDDTGAILLMAFASGDAGRGALRSPTPPSGDGCERGMTLSRSPGAALAGILVCFFERIGVYFYWEWRD